MSIESNTNEQGVADDIATLQTPESQLMVRLYALQKALTHIEKQAKLGATLHEVQTSLQHKQGGVMAQLVAEKMGKDASGADASAQAVIKAIKQEVAQLEGSVTNGLESTAKWHLRAYMQIYREMRAYEATQKRLISAYARLASGGALADEDEAVQQALAGALGAGGLTRQMRDALYSEMTSMTESTAVAHELLADAAMQSPEAFMAHQLLRMREMSRDLRNHGTMSLPGNEAKYTEIWGKMQKVSQSKGVLELLGPPGTGKTVLAKRLAEEVSGNTLPDGKKYIFVSAHKDLQPEMFLQYMSLTAGVHDASAVPQAINQAFAAYQSEHDGAEPSEEDKKSIIASVVAQQPTLKTELVDGYMALAKKHGVPLIIDEWDTLSTETKLGLNGGLDQPKEAKQGYCVVVTGNNRSEQETSGENRIAGGGEVVAVPMPAQESDLPFDAAIVERGANAPKRAIAIASLMYFLQGDMAPDASTFPQDGFEQIWYFASAFGKVQEFMQSGGGSIGGGGMIHFSSLVLSFRNIKKVMRAWKADKCKRPLEYYVFTDMVQPYIVKRGNQSGLKDSSNLNEVAMLIHIFRQYGGMFGGLGWAQDPAWQYLKINEATYGLVDGADAEVALHDGLLPALQASSGDIDVAALSYVGAGAAATLLPDMLEFVSGQEMPTEAQSAQESAKSAALSVLGDDLAQSEALKKEQAAFDKEQILLDAACPQSA